MRWDEIRCQYPERWVLVEALGAHSVAGHRILDQLAIVDTFEDSDAALKEYAALHRHAPERELYVLHTSRHTIEIAERRWLGLRGLP